MRTTSARDLSSCTSRVEGQRGGVWEGELWISCSQAPGLSWRSGLVWMARTGLPQETSFNCVVRKLGRVRALGPQPAPPVLLIRES